MVYEYVQNANGIGGGGYTYIDLNGFTNGGFGPHVSEYNSNG